MKAVISIFFLLFSTFASAKVITMRTDVWCPYACDPKSDRPGFMIEIAREIFKKYGFTIDYSVINYARAITEVKDGKYDGLIACSKAEVEGFEIPKIPTGYMKNYYWVLKNNPWMYSGPKSVQSKKFGVINNYSYGKEVDALIRAKKGFVQMSGQKPLERLIQMTDAKRIDGFIENPVVLAYSLNEMKKDQSLFKIASNDVADDPDIYIAFSPKNPKSKEYSRMLDEGMIELRKNGRLKEILAKYGLTDWQK